MEQEKEETTVMSDEIHNLVTRLEELEKQIKEIKKAHKSLQEAFYTMHEHQRRRERNF